MTRAVEISAQAHSNTSGSQGDIRRMVLDFISTQPEPVTAQEVAAALANKLATASAHNLPTRVYELERGGALEKVGTRRCRISGQVAAVYRATGRPYQPRKNTTPNTRAQGHADAIAWAEELRSLRPDWTEPLTVLIEQLSRLGEAS